MKANKPYRTAPVPSSSVPGGIPYIVGNEAAERFSYYGMRTILTIFMTKYLMDRTGQPDLMSDAEAKENYHLFSTAAYLTPIAGAFLADVFIGKYRTILWLSGFYCLGHAALALDETRTGLAIGLGLIAIGAGGIKPCVSAHVGDQFGPSSQHHLPGVFRWFYFSINLGAFASSLLTPLLLKRYGPGVAFGIPGALMFLATIVFWCGRHQFIHIPPGGKRFLREVASKEGLTTALRLGVLYVFIAPFWALFDQTGSAWVLQAEKMDLQFLGVEWLPSQVQAINPILVLVLIPIFSKLVYPALGRFFRLTPLRVIGIGLFLTTIAQVFPAWVEELIQRGETPNVGWHVCAYFVLTSAEVMVSITGLEYSYTQAPKTMKSVVMALWFASVSLGNYVTSLVNAWIGADKDASRLEGASYFWFFAVVMLVTAILFVIFALFFKEKTYIHKEAAEAGTSAPPDGE